MTATPPLSIPDAPALLAAVLELGRDLHLEKDERELTQTFLEQLAVLFPRRAIAVRVVDVRSSEPARCYARVRRVPRRRRARSHRRQGVVGREDAAQERGRRDARVKIDAIAGTRRSPASPPASRCRWSRRRRAVRRARRRLPARQRRARTSTSRWSCRSRTSSRSRCARCACTTTRSALRDYQARLLDQRERADPRHRSAWRITVCNRALLELTGFTRDELLGRDVRDFICRRSAPAADRARSRPRSPASTTPRSTVMLPTRAGRPRAHGVVDRAGRRAGGRADRSRRSSRSARISRRSTRCSSRSSAPSGSRRSASSPPASSTSSTTR